MKNTIYKLTLALLCVLLLVTGAALAVGDIPDTARAADALHTLGLFQGTDNGFALDRAPGRQEAAVMLVRLLGKEAEARAGAEQRVHPISGAEQSGHPFTDVDAWAAPHIGYMYETGLSNGVAPDRFGSETLCDAPMYATFLLRALGYSDSAGDFTYAEAVDFAAALGITGAPSDESVFLRGNVALMSYHALYTPMKDSEVLLLEKLVADGAVSADAISADTAASSVPQSDAFENLLAALNSLDFGGEQPGVDITMDGAVSMNMEGMSISVPIQSALQMRTSGEQVEMKMTMNMNLLGESMHLAFYQKDGYTYTDDGTDKMKIKTPEVPTVGDAGIDVTQYMPAIEAVFTAGTFAEERTAAGTRYTLRLDADGLNAIFAAIMPAMPDEIIPDDLGAIFNSCTFTIDITADGQLNYIGVSMDASADGMHVSIDIVATVTAIGDAVTITFPDFSDYVEG